jgi:hypothetical protein
VVRVAAHLHKGLVILLPVALVQLVVLVMEVSLRLLQTGLAVETTAVPAVAGGHRVMEAMAQALLVEEAEVQLLLVLEVI